MICRLDGGNSVWVDCSSETSIVGLKAGDEVCVQHHESSGDLLYANPNILDSFTDQQPIAFKAHLTGAQSPSANQRIIFDDVQLNLGNAYHRHLGGFLAPVHGTYLLSVAICFDTGHYIVLDLMRNKDVIGRVLAGDDAYSDCSSETTVAELQAGDEIYVQHHSSNGDLIHATSLILNSFTGALLQALKCMIAVLETSNDLKCDETE